MKKISQKILKEAGFKDMLDSLRDTFTDKPKVPQKDVKALEKFKEQSQVLYKQLEGLVKEMADLDMAGNWQLKGEGGKTTLENAIEHLRNFNTALSAPYTVTHPEPGT